MNKRSNYMRYLRPNGGNDKIPASTARRMRINQQRIDDAIAANAQVNTENNADDISADVDSDSGDERIVAANDGDENLDFEMEFAEELDPDLLPNVDAQFFDIDPEDEIFHDVVDEVEDVDQVAPENLLINDDLMAEGPNGFRIYEILLLVLSFAMRFSLSYEAVQALLKLFSLVLALPSLPTSKHLIKKIFDAKNSVKYHFECSLCKGDIKVTDSYPLRDENVVCGACSTANKIKSCNMFLSIGLKQQIQATLENPDAARYLLNRNENTENPNLCDISDGALYKELKTKVDLKKSDVTLSFNADGMQRFKSNFGSIWGKISHINELPAKLRFSEMMVTGIWFGKGEPCMQTFFKHFTDELNVLQTGFTWLYNGTKVLTRVFALCCCVDSKARAPILNMAQFNGYYGCPWCYHPGHNIKTETNPTGAIKYTTTYGHYNLRTDSEIRSDMNDALLNGNKKWGFKGLSILTRLPNFNLARGVVVDYMHCVLLGVIKAMITLWLEGSPDSEYYLGHPNTVSVIDERLLKLNINRTMHRSARKISDFCHWKASEFKNFLLYFSVPVLLNILPELFHKHLMLLVSALFLLLQQEISENDLVTAENLILEFVTQYQDLYGEENMTFNVHQLLHLVQSVRDLGPLWTHSCFPFESFNAIILKQVNGPGAVVSQIAHRFKIRDAMNKIFCSLRNKLNDGTVWFMNLMSQHNAPKPMQFSSGDQHCHFDDNLSSLTKINQYRNLCTCVDQFFTKGMILGNLIVGSDSTSKAARNDAFLKLDGKVIEVSCMSTCKDSNNGMIFGHEWTVHQPFDSVNHIVNLVHRGASTNVYHVDAETIISKLVLVECSGLKYACDVTNKIETE